MTRAGGMVFWVPSKSKADIYKHGFDGLLLFHQNLYERTTELSAQVTRIRGNASGCRCTSYVITFLDISLIVPRSLGNCPPQRQDSDRQGQGGASRSPTCPSVSTISHIHRSPSLVHSPTSVLLQACTVHTYLSTRICICAAHTPPCVRRAYPGLGPRYCLQQRDPPASFLPYRYASTLIHT